MTIEYKTIKSFDEFDYETLFDNSKDVLDASAAWAPNMSDDEKKTTFKNQILANLDSPNFLMFIGTSDKNELQFIAGTIHNNIFIPRYSLSSKLDGNRNWLYSEENRTAISKFYGTLGITQYQIETFIGSAVYKMFKARNNTGKISIISEKDTQIMNNIQWVNLLIAF